MRALGLLAAAWIGAFAVGVAPAQEEDLVAASGVDAIVAVTASLEIELTLLDEDTQRYDQLSGRRARAMARLDELYRSLDQAIRAGDGSGANDVTRLMDQIELAEEERVGLLIAERVLVDRISERRRKIVLFEERLQVLRHQAQQSGGVLSGVWDVSLLPGGQRGQFRIRQSGTLLSGTYTLDGGWTGSLQGTLVNRKVYLVRIDSRLGKMMELEGNLSSDREAIRGTWLNYELAGQQGGTGQWAASRRKSAP